jgi:hypothetical protein
LAFTIFAQHLPKVIPLSSTDSLNIKFLFPFSQINDSSQLVLKVVYKNNTNKYVSVYKRLAESSTGNHYSNISIEMEKLDKKKYEYHFLTCRMGGPFSLVDSVRHYDPPKKQLAPYASDTLALNILQVAGGFWPGKYRFKALLRVKTLRNNQEYTDSTFATAPPEDTIEYVSSDWLYFTVQNYIQKRMNRSDK